MSPALERVRLGIVGAGNIADMNVAGYLEHPLCDVVAVCDVDEGSAKAAAGLALYLLAGALACAQDVSQPLDAPARLAFDMASAQANVAGLAILTLMLLATITAVLHLIGRRIWTRRTSCPAKRRPLQNRRSR